MTVVYYHKKYIRVEEIYTLLDLSSLENSDVISIRNRKYSVIETRGHFVLVRDLDSWKLYLVGNPIGYIFPPTRNQVLGILGFGGNK